MQVKLPGGWHSVTKGKIMDMFYSATTNGFYCAEVHGNKIPTDAIPVEWNIYTDLIGKHIVANEFGQPVLYVAPTQTFEEVRQELLQKITDYRYDLEVGGITLNGNAIGTDRDDQNSLANAVALIDLVNPETIDFKARSGWITLTPDVIKAIACAVGQFKQACFSAERAHQEIVQVLEDSMLASYNYTINWPSTEF